MVVDKEDDEEGDCFALACAKRAALASSERYFPSALHGLDDTRSLSISSLLVPTLEDEEEKEEEEEEEECLIASTSA